MDADFAGRNADLHFYFDPVCPFAWMTSKWVRMVAEQRDYTVEWRFISLRMVNAHIDYEAHFPPEYEAGHNAGLRLLRVAARTRAECGPEAVGKLYLGLGRRIFDTVPVNSSYAASEPGSHSFLTPILDDVDLPPDLASALDDSTFDAELRAETDEALALTGSDVGTPILHFQPPDGLAFFGPVISRVPTPQNAGPLWDNVIALASFPGFAELKRSLRELPQLVGLGVDLEEPGVEQDWHGGSRRTKD